MTDEEIREYARNIIIEACVNVGFVTKNGKLYGLEPQKDNTTILVVESENGEIGFKCKYVSASLEFTTVYFPQSFIESLLRIRNSQLNSEDYADLPTEAFKEFWDDKINDITKILIAVLVFELFEPLALVPTLAFKTYNFLSDDNILRRTDAERKQQVNKILEDFNKRRRARILDFERQHIESLSAPQYVFCDIYDAQLKRWREAKAFYTRNKKSADIIEDIKQKFSDLPEELVEKLNLKGESEPNRLALETTAWLLNVPDKINSERKLERYLQESRKQRKQISDEEATKALEKYFSFTEQLEDWNDKINQAIKNETKSLFSLTKQAS